MTDEHKLSVPAQEYIDEFRDQDARTAKDYADALTQVFHGETLEEAHVETVQNIEERAIRDFDLYVTASGGRILTKDEWDKVESILDDALDLYEDDFMDSLEYFEEEGTLDEQVEVINFMRKMTGQKPVNLVIRHGDGTKKGFRFVGSTLEEVVDATPEG